MTNVIRHKNTRINSLAYKCNDINRGDDVIQPAFALLRYEMIPALFPVAHRRIAVMPSHIHFLRNLQKPEGSDFLEFRLHRMVGEVLWIGPVEEINVHVNRLWRLHPKLVIH